MLAPTARSKAVRHGAFPLAGVHDDDARSPAMLLDLLAVLLINPLGLSALRAGIESRKDLCELNEIADPNARKPYLHEEVEAPLRSRPAA
jgi:hypothetical protein